jgi:hypothetical protein
MRFATATITTDTPSTPANREAEPSAAPRPAVDRCDRDRLIADHYPLVRTIAGGIGRLRLVGVSPSTTSWHTGRKGFCRPRSASIPVRGFPSRPLPATGFAAR